MPQKRKLLVSGGSTVGNNHIGPEGSLLLEPNQDSFDYFETSAGEVVAFVCDGCSHHANSHVGSRIGVRLLVRAFSKYLSSTSKQLTSKTIDQALKTVQAEVANNISTIASLMQSGGKTLEEIIREYFLFTVVGVYVGKEDTLFFNVGDGLLAVDKNVYTLGPFKENSPPYLSYVLLPSMKAKFGADLQMALAHHESTADWEAIAIGSDGCNDLVAQEPNENFEEYFAKEANFRNPALIARTLRLLNMPKTDYEVERSGTGWNINKRYIDGPLKDDTTMVLIRKESVKAAPAPAKEVVFVPDDDQASSESGFTRAAGGEAGVSRAAGANDDDDDGDRDFLTNTRRTYNGGGVGFLNFFGGGRGERGTRGGSK